MGPEVTLYSSNKLLRGNCTTKVENMSIDAFASPNSEPLATFGVDTMVNSSLVQGFPRKRFSISTNLFTDICVFRLVPGLDDTCIRIYIDHQKKNPEKDIAIIFSLYGTGNAPMRKDGFLKLVGEAIDAGMTIVVNSQCLKGRVSLGSYETGISLLKMGVISAENMTIEACVTKLMYLMGKGYSGPRLKDSMESNLAGELSAVSEGGFRSPVASQLQSKIKFFN